MSSSRGRQLRLFAVVAILAMLAAACGLKPDVQQRIEFARQGGQDQFAGGEGLEEGGFDDGGFDDGSGVALEDGGFDDGGFDDGSGTTGGGFSTTTGGTTGGGTTGGGTTGGGTTGGGTTGGTTGGGTTGGGTTGGGTTGGGTTGGGSTGGGGGTTGGGDSTGITAEAITIGIHAPLTGAAPLPAASFNEGKDKYWNFIGEVAGRQVEVVFRDDKYNPSTATQVCNEMIQQEKVFLLIGAGGTDQIAACARTAAQQGVPYLSAGVTENQLNQLPNYFAISMSYAQQAPLLVQWISANASPSNNRIAVIRSDTPNFDDGINAFLQAAQQAGFEVVERKLSKDPSSAEKAQAAQFLLQNQIEVAYPLMAPADWVEIAKQPGARGVQWAGVGITMGINTVATAACPEIDGAMFFNPYPGLNTVGQLDPSFQQAGGGDDIVWGLWGLSKTVHEVFKAMGNNLTREAFVGALQSNRIASGIYPELRHSSNDHFGATSVHVLIADCGQRQYVTPNNGLFRSSF